MKAGLQITAIGGLLVAWILTAPSAQAQTQTDKPAAIIEDIKASGIDYEILEILVEGTIIQLADDETVKLAYLRSCIVEEVKGGTVTVGETESKLSGGIIQHRETVDCDGGGIVPTERQAQDAAGVIFRAPTVGNDELMVLVYATAPVFSFAKNTRELSIERINADVIEKHVFPVTGSRFDLMDQGVRLAPGALYRATSDESTILFRISRKATASTSAAISRLVRF